MSYETILFTVDRGVARLTLNRPDKLNSFNTQMHEDVRHALENLQSQRRAGIGSDRRRTGLLRRAGSRRPGRCARRARPSISANRSRSTTSPWFSRCIDLPMPVIAAVNGVAAGAGANIALACDLVIAARSASFVQAFAKLGLVPDSGGTWILPRLVGNARALGLTLLGQKLPAEQAAAWGMIWQCVDDAELSATVDALAQQLAVAPTRGLAATKAAIRGGWQRSLAEQLDIERDAQRELGRSADYAEGVAAFTEKRTPLFKGR